MGRFQDQIAVITGGGSGIGEQTARRIVLDGGSVFLIGRTEEKLKGTCNLLNEIRPNSADYIVADVTQEEEVQHVKEELEERTPLLHVVVNNAGGSSQSTIMDLSLDEWQRVQDVNLTSVFLVSKCLSPRMVKEAERDGNNRAIVNVASLSGHKAGAEIPHYSAAKASVIHFTKALAAELSPKGVRVNSVSPGFTRTPLTEEGLENERFKETIRRKTALQRVGDADEIANVIAFAASKEASYMTGSDLLVDGGWLLT
ncbi:short-chain dehydrogenase [Pontibacillus halophilus JSM 076056 = DSM 19796]|uniref:Short-chain dehydrogenase n=1 Tax=Pontibacillus halophilus JSM 076056 = DSM 19796 TaxID=1385510 RepID=A0A0A5GHY4_9BACI|nr:SDR family oxidoreductase [Pontibacillus halophilus]KGX92861.1 short-chain dehydrogenase [Pontibacillus halophilus JSM 076056 = DSM 19796]